MVTRVSNPKFLTTSWKDTKVKVIVSLSDASPILNYYEATFTDQGRESCTLNLFSHRIKLGSEKMGGKAHHRNQ